MSYGITAANLSSQDQQIRSLQARIGSSEQALEALEQTATKQMEGLTQKSSNALDRLQRQLGIAYSQLEQLHSFIKVFSEKGNSKMFWVFLFVFTFKTIEIAGT